MLALLKRLLPPAKRRRVHEADNAEKGPRPIATGIEHQWHIAIPEYLPGCLYVVFLPHGPGGRLCACGAHYSPANDSWILLRDTKPLPRSPLTPWLKESDYRTLLRQQLQARAPHRKANNL